MLALAYRAFLLIPILVACAEMPPRTPQGSEDTVVISLQNIDCESCGKEATDQVQKLPGVGKITFDRDRAELTVSFDASRVSSDKILSSLKQGNLQAVLGAGKGSYLEDTKFPEGADVKWISKEGEDVDVKAHLAPGKVNVIDFYAKWCGPCREVDQEMLRQMKDNASIALRKVNVVDWNSAVAKRYKIPNLPYVVVYGTKGELVEKISGLELERLRNAIRKGKGK